MKPGAATSARRPLAPRRWLLGCGLALAVAGAPSAQPAQGPGGAGLPAPVASPVAAAPRAAVAPAELLADLPGAALRGQAVMRFFGLHVYDIRLWAPSTTADPSQPPLALELVYGRKLAGAQIASRSIDEMRKVGSLTDAQATRWGASMAQLFPDVQQGDRLTGVMLANGSARFHFNGQWRGEVADADFSRLFFGIWLSPRTSEPRLREQLLGLTR